MPPIISSVIGQKAISARTPATVRPLYSAGITFLLAGLGLDQNQVPTIEAMMAKPPITSG